MMNKIDPKKSSNEIFNLIKKFSFQNEEKELALITANQELTIRNEETEKLVADLFIATQELAIQNKQRGKLTQKLMIANEELEKAKRDIDKLNESLEQKIIKRTTQYNFISQINQGIVHIKDEQTLFQNVCGIGIEIGKFKMAWITIFDISNKTFSLVAQSGILEEDLNLFTNVPYQKNGPHDSVLQNSRYYICNDIENEIELAKWKPIIAKLDIRSCMILPIKKAGNIIGTFNLSATEINFFGKEEIALLVEASENISFALDIFENEKKHKATKELIVQNEKRFRTLVENGDDAVAILSPTGSVIYVSPSVERILGYTEEEIMKLDMFSLIHTDDLEGVGKVWEHVLTTSGVPIPGHTSRMLHKDGTWRWLAATVTNMLHDPAINGIVDNFWDVTEIRKAEERKEFNKNNLNALINSTSDLMWSMDKDFKLITFNQPLHDLIKLLTGKSISKGFEFLSIAVTEKQLSRFKRYYERAFAGERFKEIEHYNIPTETWIETSYNPILKGEEVIGAACHSRDITQVKMNEKTIKEERIILRTLIDNLPSNVYVKDIHSRKTLSNRADYEYIGAQSEEEVLGKDDSFFFSDETSRDTIIEEQQIFSTGEPIINKEEHQKKKDNSAIWFLKSKIPLRNQHNEIIGLLGISHDITERKKAEKQLKKSEAFNRGVLDSLNSHIAVVDGKGKIIAVNEAWKQFSIENGETDLQRTGVGSNYFEVCKKASETGDEIAAEVLQGMKDVLNEKRTVFNIEYPCHSPTEKRWFSMRVMKFDSDEKMVVVAHLDITERKLAQETLLLTQIAIDNAGDAVFWMSPNAQIVNVNEAACIMLGYAREELLKLSVPDIDPNYNVKIWPIHFVELRQKGSLFFETIQQAKDGRLIPVEVRANYVKFGDTEFNCAFIRDITERKIEEEEREKITADIVQRNKDLEQFSFIISHNLRAPVANIIGLSELAQDEDLESDMKKEVLEGLSQSVKKLDDVINDLNNILQVKREISHKKEMVHFSQLANNIHISIKNLIEKEKAVLIWDFSDIDEMLTLKSYIHSIFYNLISNSLKYRQPNIPPIIEIKSRKLNNKIELIFKDNGMGIDLKRKGEQVFGLYKRFHTETAEGKGMGLYMVKTQVESIGGKISIESEVNKGTTFRIQF